MHTSIHIWTAHICFQLHDSRNKTRCVASHFKIDTCTFTHTEMSEEKITGITKITRCTIGTLNICLHICVCMWWLPPISLLLLLPPHPTLFFFFFPFLPLPLPPTPFPTLPCVCVYVCVLFFPLSLPTRFESSSTPPTSPSLPVLFCSLLSGH